MPHIKIHPLKQLPERSINKQEFEDRIIRQIQPGGSTSTKDMVKKSDENFFLEEKKPSHVTLIRSALSDTSLPVHKKVGLSVQQSIYH